ncbi:amidohydrolase family protein (plasmid) [Cupriavidus pinatubonensis]|uniref:amidohydrolase family protein n=1 Tax=Cupriavidus pinatubonensis TaxID=248026 RepID=UPI001C7371DE|nr:amidohydrolase family protein [Cupriavidus pinatubonensis]QYY33663.1 amidohydrolase family protein [Cupriavidus pinatubonensis]
MNKTYIENGTVIAWINGAHTVIERGVVVIEGNSIIEVGAHTAPPSASDTRIDATGRIVMPGFVNTHLHVTDTPYTKGYLEDASNLSPRANATNYGTLYKTLPAVRHAIDPEAQVIASECAFAELARTGSTTVVELGYDYEVGGDGDISITEQIAQVAMATGLRCYSGPRYRAMHYGHAPGGKVWYQSYPENGRRRFRDCVDFCIDWDGRYDGRLRTLLAPGQIDTCDPDLLRETRRVASAHKLPIQIHAGQSPNEYERIKTEYGMSTVEYMIDTGLLGPDFMIGHGQILTHDGNIASLTPSEAAALRDYQTTVVHLPWVKARRGGVINSIHKYRQLNIRQALGTDTYPFDMFNDMRMAATVCRIVEHSIEAATSVDIFTMATAGGADALGRPDLGRLAVGCKADVVLVRMDTFKAAPTYDPFKFLVLAATGEDVDRVLVDGKTIVEGGLVLAVDMAKVVARLNNAASRVRANVAD